MIALNEKLDRRIEEVIQEGRAKVEEIRGKYTDLFAEHETLKENYKAKDEEAKYFMNELARYKEQYDEKLVRRLTDQIDSLSLDITMLNMKNNDLKEEIDYLRKANVKIKTDWEMKRVEEVDE